MTVPLDMIRSLAAWLHPPVPLEAGTAECFGDRFLMLVPLPVDGSPPGSAAARRLMMRLRNHRSARLK